jgi:hypothetical protein
LYSYRFHSHTLYNFHILLAEAYQDPLFYALPINPHLTPAKGGILTGINSRPYYSYTTSSPKPNLNNQIPKAPPNNQYKREGWRTPHVYLLPYFIRGTRDSIPPLSLNQGHYVTFVRRSPRISAGTKSDPPPPTAGKVVCCSQQVTSVVALPLQGRGVNNALGLLN